MTFVRGAVGAVVVLATLLVTPQVSSARPPDVVAESVVGPTGPIGGGVVHDDASSEAGATFFWGIEIRSGGLRTCSNQTPEPCSPWVWRYLCPIGGVARVLDVTTYMDSEGLEYVDYTARARLVPRGQSGVGEPWVAYTTPTNFTARKMIVRNPSDSVASRKSWDLLVQLIWDRTGRPDVVRSYREPVEFQC